MFARLLRYFLALVACSILVPFLSAADFVGHKVEYLTSDFGSTKPPALQGTFTIASGGTRDFSPGLLEDVEGNRYTYYWSTQKGKLDSLAVRNNHIRYTAPLVATRTIDMLYLWVGSESGLSAEAVINVVISPSDTPPPSDPPTTGQLTAAYDSGNSRFVVSYQLGVGATSSVIQVSFDGGTWTDVTTINPGADGLTGIKNVSVPDSLDHRLLSFRLQVTGASGSTEVTDTTSTGYVPTPVTPKSTEIPARPELTITGYETNTTSVELRWQRVNDSLHNDNVVSYEVRYADNSSFSGATTQNVGNPAAGGNMYETLRHTVTGLGDGKTWYFQVRGINNKGAGDWSHSDSIRVNVQDLPVFAVSNPLFPADGATGVSKLPDLRFDVDDADGDSLEFRVFFGESPGEMYPLRGFGDSRRGIPEFSSDEWRKALRPDQAYYWRVEVRESGRKLDYYGGAYPSSPVWSFTTENTGSSLTFLSANIIEGMVKPGGRVTYRVTVRNDGSEVFDRNFLQATYAKAGSESEFLLNLGGEIAELGTGESTITDLTIQFREDLFTSSAGIAYDNVLISGSSEIRLRTRKQDDQNAGADFYAIPVSYTGGGGPQIEALVLRGHSGDVYTPREGRVQIITNIVDDLQTERVLLEYRYNSGAWTLVDDFTGNVSSKMHFDESSHSGPTVALGQNSLNWFLPASVPLTSTLQIRVTAWDNDGQSTTMTSGNFQVIDNTISVTAGATDLTHYQAGQQVSFPVTVVAPGPIDFYRVDLLSGTRRKRVLTQTTTDPQGFQIPPVLTVTLPGGDFYDHPGAYLEVYVNAENSGGGNVQDTDTTDGTFVLETKDSPAPFHESIKTFDGYFNFPGGSINREEKAEPIALDWEGDDNVHILFKHRHFYHHNGTDYEGAEFHHIIYNRLTQTVSRSSLGSSRDYFELEVVGGVVHVLYQDNNNIYLQSKSGGGFSSPQFLVTVDGFTGGDPSLFEYNSEAYFGWVQDSSQSSSIRRNRFRKIGPPLGAVTVHSLQYLGTYVSYGSHISATRGAFTRNTDLSANSQFHSWFSNPMRFASDEPTVVAAEQNYDGGPYLNLLSSVGVVTRWDAHLQYVNLLVSPQYEVAVGQGQGSPYPLEGNRNMVVRRDRNTGEEVRIPLGTYGANLAAEVMDRSAITSQGWTAVSWARSMVVGNFGGDIVGPEVEILNLDDSFTSDNGLQLEWSQSDQHGSLASYSVYRVANGAKQLITSATSGLTPTKSLAVAMPNQARVAIRVEVVDNSGNRGVAEKVFRQVPSVTISDFDVDLTAVDAGEMLNFSWTATPAEPLRVFTLLNRAVGGSAWTAVGSFTGSGYRFETTGLDGSYEFKLETPGGSSALAQPVVVTGGFTFLTEGFAPAGAEPTLISPTLHELALRWDSNRVVSPQVIYRVLVRWDGAGDWLEVTRTDAKQATIDVGGGHNLVEWRIATLQEGGDVTSPAYSVNLATFGVPANLAASPSGLDQPSPSVDLVWTVDPLAETYAINRVDEISGAVRAVARLTGDEATFRDTGVVYGGQYRYRISSLAGVHQSDWSADVAVSVESSGPTGVVFANADYQTLAGNQNTVSWQAIDAGSGTPAYRAFDAVLRRGNGAVVDSWSGIESLPGNTAELTFSDLDYSEGYFLEVFTLGADGVRLGNAPALLHFSAAPDNRALSGAPTIGSVSFGGVAVRVQWSAVGDADYYDVFRKAGTGDFVWIGRTAGQTWRDDFNAQGEQLGYFVRARNGFMATDGATDSSLTIPVAGGDSLPVVLGVSVEEQAVDVRFLGEAGESYKVQSSSDAKNWGDEVTGVNGEAGPVTVTVPGQGSDDFQNRHFRVVEE